jgi:tRNA(Ile)-lysidine synthase
MDGMESAKKFLLSVWDPSRPVLLGYSGGPDSKALLYFLLEIGCTRLEVAHLDHGWREESRVECEALKAEITSLGLPFHSTRLPPGPTQNREDVAREARLSFFASLFKQGDFQALLLGHQADDLAETVLKRTLEGAHLISLGGMQKISEMRGMPIWRPFLSVPKKKLLSFLSQKNLRPIWDPTNKDPTYLRSRMREQTLPLLEESFGKNIAGNLALLSERSYELKLYLDEKVASRQIFKKEWGSFVDCNALQRIEARHLLQKISEVTWPRTVLEQVLDWIEEGGGYRKIFFQSRWIFVRKGWVFCSCNFLSSSEIRELLEIGQTI